MRARAFMWPPWEGPGTAGETGLGLAGLNDFNRPWGMGLSQVVW